MDEIEEIMKKKMENMVKGQNDARTKVDVKAKAREFALTIQVCDEYKSFLKSSRDLENDRETRKLLEDFQQKQMELRNRFDPRIMDELRGLQTKINQNILIQNYVRSQQDLIELLGRTNTVISARIGSQFAFSQGGCCG